MNTRTIILLTAILCFSLATGLALAGPEYTGASKCKMCHKTEYASWETTSHAKAFDLLKGDEASDAACLKCHATGDTAEMPGVQCESCHGAGSDYKAMKVMKDHEASLAAGLVVPVEATCRGCHEGAPHDQAAFDYETAKTTGLHEVKAK